jgi:hypothetical protein
VVFGPRYDIVAPSYGQIVRIEDNAGLGATGSARVTVVLQMNDYWFVILSLETQSLDAGIGTEQRDAVVVSERQFVEKGEPIGQLVTGSLLEGTRLPHIHYALLYKNDPEREIDAIMAWKAARSDGSDLGGVWPWSWYPGVWPWRSLPGRNLGIRSKFFCPYEFSSPAARTAMDSVNAYAGEERPCACACAYGSTGGSCGLCGTRTPP